MIMYHPIDCGAEWQSDLADLRLFDWQSGTAEWEIAGELPRTVIVQFSGPIIARMLDDFPLSTENVSAAKSGLVRDHFAYIVEGDPFEAAQSPAWKEVAGATKHYRFMTGNCCLDVISSASPSFSIFRRKVC